MKYLRPQPISKLSKRQKVALLGAYYEYYRRTAAQDPRLLNRKIPREALTDLLDQIGALLLEQSRQLAAKVGSIRAFLDDNPLPEPMAGLLPDEFRVFCLSLNALKQWVSAEQLSTDRFLLGGTGRQVCRDAATECIVTGVSLDPADAELHHPVRDGRPPIPLSKEGHVRIESRSGSARPDEHLTVLQAVKRKGNRSWVQLRRGCLDLLGKEPNHTTPKVAASSKSFAREASRATSMSYAEIINWLDERDYGEILNG